MSLTRFLKYPQALLPQPVDYFRVCGTTDLCAQRCADELSAFNAANVLPSATEVTTESVQSLFFNQKNSDANNPLSPAFAAMELQNCTALCGTVNSANGYSDRCLIVAGQSLTAQLQVLGFCVPIAIGASVRRGGTFTIPGIDQISSAIAFGFVFRPDVGQDGFWSGYQLLALLNSGLWSCHSSCSELLELSDLDSDVVKLTGMTVLGNLVVLTAQYLDGATLFSSSSRAYCYHLLGIYQWEGPYRCTPDPISQYAYPVCQATTDNACPRVLLVPYQQLPDGTNLPVRICSQAAGVFTQCQSFTTTRSFAYQASVPQPSSGAVMSSTAVLHDPSVWQVFTAAGPQQVSGPP